MKLCRYGKDGHEKPGMIDSQGKLRDLSKVIGDIDAEALSPRISARIAQDQAGNAAPRRRQPAPRRAVHRHFQIRGDRSQLLRSRRRSRHGGAHRADHFHEGDDLDLRTERRHRACRGIRTKLDWECELAIVIGTKAQYVTEEDSLNYVAGYCVANDVSERAFQLQSSQWDKGKGCDTFGPIGPWLVTADEVPDPQNLDMWLDVNGQRMQSGNTRTMIFGVRKIVSYCSHYMTLLPGRRHLHRHAAGRRHGQEAQAGLSQGRRRSDARHPGTGRSNSRRSFQHPKYLFYIVFFRWSCLKP